MTRLIRRPLAPGWFVIRDEQKVGSVTLSRRHRYFRAWFVGRRGPEIKVEVSW